MSMTTAIKTIVDEKMKSLYVAFLAEILSVNGDKAKIQPLGLVRDYGGAAKKQAVIANVHIAQSARQKIETKEIEYITSVDFDNSSVKKGKTTIVQSVPIKKGNIVLCVCCDRNIASALKGENALPPIGCHNQSDCVIVAII